MTGRRASRKPSTTPGTRPRDGVCLEFPQKHLESDLSLVAVVRRAMAEPEVSYMDAVEKYLTGRLALTRGLTLTERLAAAGFVCEEARRAGGTICGLSFGIVGWRYHDQRPGISDLCNLSVRVLVPDEPARDASVLANGVCL